MPTLSRSTLPSITTVEGPSYDLDKVNIGVLHMGLGAFHRAHQAVFFDNVLRKGNSNFGVCAVSQRSPLVADTLAEQDCLYTVNASDHAVERPRIIGSIRESAYFPRDEQRLIDLASNPELRLITITVSEKAYLQSLPERLSLLLHSRFLTGGAPLAIISCDNLPSNGEYTHSVIQHAIANESSEFKKWVEAHVRFPNSMVDRIVPAITSTRIDQFESKYGYRDLSLITAEPFSEWVIEHDEVEDELIGSGIRFVNSVAPYELAKIRLFNGVHSTLAYLGQLLSIEYVADVISDSRISEFVQRMQEDEIAQSFITPNDLNLIEYATQIRQRISNPTLLHRTKQIAMDGSQKLPQRLFSTANDLYEKSLPSSRVCLAIAIWLHYLGEAEELDDPLALELQAFSKSRDSNAAVRGCLTLSFASQVNPLLYAPISRWLDLLRTQSLWKVLSTLESENE